MNDWRSVSDWLKLFAIIGALKFSLANASAETMTFTLTPLQNSAKCGANCPIAIVANGEIEDSTPEDFVNFVKENVTALNLLSVVIINSPGGSVVAAMKLGVVFRSSKVIAIVARVPSDGESGDLIGGQCLSACVYAFMGAKKRIAPRQSVLGIHRMMTYEPGVDPATRSQRLKHYDDGDMSQLLSIYADRMGVNREIIARAEKVPAETMHILTPQEIRTWRLAESNL